MRFQSPETVRFYVQWLGASGVFNNLSLVNPQESERLDSYSRWDAGIQYSHDFGNVNIELKASVYYVFNQKKGSLPH